MFCSYCGSRIPDEASFCPFCNAQLRRPTPLQQPAVKTPLPALALAFGIVSAIAAVICYFISFFRGIYSYNSLSLLLMILTVLLGIGSIIFGAVGLRRSIHTGGRKYVAGIVLSAVGLSCGVVAFIFLFLSLFIGNLFRHLF